MKSILKYRNYRKYILDCKKSMGSYRKLAAGMGFETDSFLIEVVQGKKNLGIKSAKRIAKCQRFNKTELTHFIKILLKSDYKVIIF